MRARMILLLVAALALTCPAGASAYWRAGGTGSSSGVAGTLKAPADVSAAVAANSDTVSVTWTPSAGAPTPQGYYVVRTRTSDSARSAACGSSATTLITGAACSDTGVANGGYRYSVVAKYRTWTAESASSSTVTVARDLTPDSAVTFPAAGGAYRSATWTAGCANRICGTATDRSGAGLQGVRVSVQRATGSYWNGTAFASASEVTFAATLTGTTWTLPFAASGLSADGGYTVRAYATDSAGHAQTAATGASFTMDSTAPANALSLTAQSPAGSSVLAGASNIVFYRGASAGSFRLRNAVADATSGPASSTTGALGATTTGWTHAAGAVTSPAGGPFDSGSFAWAAGTTSSPTEVVTGADAAGNTTAAPALTFKNDSTAPAGGALTVNATAAGAAGSTSYDTDGSFTIGRTDFTETQSTTASGLASSTLTREDAVLSGNTCASFGAPVTLTGAPAQNPAAGIAAGNCYRYTLTALDTVGNTASVATTVKVDTSAPPAPTLAFGGLVNAFYAPALNTLYFRPAAGGAYTVTAASADPQSDLKSANAGYTFSSLSASNFTLTQSAGQASYTFGASANQPAGSPNVVAVNNAGASSPATSYALKSDATAPAGGALSVNGTSASAGGTTSFDTDGDFTIATRTDYAEAQSSTASGLAASDLTVETAPLSNGTCGPYGAATAITGAPAQNDLPDACYRYTLTGTDRVGNTAALITTVKVDTTAPSLVSLVMLDNDNDGRVDHATATFSETLAAYTAGNTPWTLTGVPSAGTLHVTGGGGVTVSGAVATLVIDEGAGAADTAVGAFKIALAANAAGIRDAAGNRASFAATAPADGADPVALTLTDTGGATDGRFEAGDTLTVTFSEAITGAGATTTVQLTGGNGAGSDQLTLSGVTSAGSLGRSDYIAGNGSVATFTASALSQPTAAQLRVTLAACSGACASLTTATGTGSFVFNPLATLTDLAGNPAGGATFTIRLF